MLGLQSKEKDSTAQTQIKLLMVTIKEEYFATPINQLLQMTGPLI